MAELLSVDPFRCRMWWGHERLEDGINEESCRAEIDSFLRHGQQLPVLGRRLKRDETYDFELVYGARRLFVARHLNVPLCMEVRDLTDRAAVVVLDIENRQRKELSPYERGRAYSRWIREGVFSSRDDLARALHMSSSQVSRLMRLAELPSDIVNAFASPVDICEVWGRSLMDLWDDPEIRHAIGATAQAIAEESPQRQGASVFKRLVEAANSKRGTRRAEGNRDEVVKDNEGNLLFRVRQHQNDTALLLPADTVSSTVLSEIMKRIAVILHRARAQVADLRTQHPVKMRARQERPALP